jgi:hypothetical protein
VLLSDLLAEDDGREALAARARDGDDVSVVHVVAAADAAPDAPEGAFLEDVETKERVVLDGRSARAALRHAARLEEEWRTFAARHRLRYVPVDAAAPLGATVVRALRSAGVLA